MCTRASYKSTRTWENFNNQGTKMIFLSDKLWLVTNKSKSIIRIWICVSTLKLTLFRTIQKHCYRSDDLRHRFGKERCIKQIDDIREWQKNWWKKVMSKICLSPFLCKLDWEVNLFDLYAEFIAFKIKILINITLF